MGSRKTGRLNELFRLLRPVAPEDPAISAPVPLVCVGAWR